jgi:uncharacterized protein (TIGR02246 family)
MRPVLTRILPALLVAVCAAVPARAAADDARTAIEAANKKFMETFARGDADALAGMYSEKGVALAPSSQPAEGRAAIHALWQSIIDSKAKDFKLQTTDVQQAGDLASETGRYTVTLANGQTTSGNYVVVWKREAGAWKLYRDIWN